MMSKLSGLVFLCVLALPIPAAWSDEAPSASPAATTEAPAASTPAAATAAAPTEPTLMAADKISAGDTAWMLTSTALVLMMSVPHLALTIPETVYAMFQLTFAAITPALIAGAFADRMKFSAMLVFMAAWSLLVYSPIAHMVWEPTGWLNKAGVLDYAGGTVVHINAGVAGLASCLVLGKRLGYGKETMAPHNLTLTLIGASLLWVGWFGFNAGSAGAADGRAGMAMLVTQL